MARDERDDDATLSCGQLNRALLARQYLLDRVPAALPSALEQVAGLPAQHGSAYVSLWARIAGFDRDELTACLEDRSVVQATLMRQAIHVVSQSDFVMMSAGVRRARQAWWLRVSRSRGLSETDYRVLADRLTMLLKEGPKTRGELLDEIERSGYPRHAFEGVVLWLDLVRVPPPGTWDHPQADLYGLAVEWVNPTLGRIDQVDESAGLDLLVQRYLRAFGPAGLGDVASWAGVPVAALEPSSERLDLRRFRDERGAALLDLPFGPLPDGDTPVPVRFLPTWDAALLVHTRRAGIVPDQLRDELYRVANPVGHGAFLVDGSVAGTWRVVDERVEITAFAPMASHVEDEVRSEADHLRRFHLGR
ncbi:MAG: winged helix DNA-binding domain-containing protein [Acidimicrobiales bacterium]